MFVRADARGKEGGVAAALFQTLEQKAIQNKMSALYLGTVHKLKAAHRFYGKNGFVEILKADYARMIVKSYKSRSEESRVMFLLSSENFLQAYKRAQYMKQYSNFRKMLLQFFKPPLNRMKRGFGEANDQRALLWR